MPKITIDKEKCKGCLLCISFCPKGLIVVDEKLNLQGIKPVRFSRLPPSRDPDIVGKGGKSPECLGCALCAVICPDCCIEAYK